jgi:hypothetical protein
MAHWEGCVKVIWLVVKDGQSSLLIMLMVQIWDLVCGRCTQTRGKFNNVVRLEPNPISWLMDLLMDGMEEMMGSYAQKLEVQATKEKFISQVCGMDYQCEDSCIHNFRLEIMVSKVGFIVITFNSVENNLVIRLGGFCEGKITSSQGDILVCNHLEGPLVCLNLIWLGPLVLKQGGF